MVVLGIGIGRFYPTATTAGVTSVDESQTSLAGGIVYMFQIAGGSIGLGLTTTVFSSQASFVDGIEALSDSTPRSRWSASSSRSSSSAAGCWADGRPSAPRPESALRKRA